MAETAKKGAKQTVKKAAAQKETKKAEATFTQDQVNEIVAKAVEEALAKQAANQAQVIRVSADAPMVKLRFQCECSPVNYIQFGVNGKFGAITGRTGSLTIPKESFLGEFRDQLVQSLLESRELIVLDGLTDEEREMYGVQYRKGEYMDEKTFAKMVDMGDEILDIYPDLNQTYKDMVAKRFAEEYEKNPKKISRELVRKLNDMSKKGVSADDPRKKGAFTGVLHAMNDADEKGE